MTTLVNTIPLKEKLKSIPGFFGIRLEEEPKFYILYRHEDMQIRKYYPFLMAQTFVRGDYHYASNEGFYRLANYIFGSNSNQEKISMSTPVFQGRSKKLVMASPVLHQQHHDGWMMSFVLPSKFKQDNLPKPLNPNIEIVSVPALMVASIRYSGRNTEEKMQTMSNELVSWLQERGDYQIISEPRSAQYDSPHTVPLLRRNEIQITVAEQSRRLLSH